MGKTEATAATLFAAFEALPAAERDAFLARLVRDRSVAQDLLDLAVIEERRGELSRPFREYLAESGRS